MTLRPFTVLERDTHVTWFGLVLWDVLGGAVASDGIDVRVWPWPVTTSMRAVTATANRSGVFVSNRLPAHALASPDAGYLVEVRDTGDRFTSFVMRVPSSAGTGFVRPRCAGALVASQSPESGRFQLPLFNLPSRTPPPASAVVRARLIDSATQRPAEWAVLEIGMGGQLLGRGIANEHGEAAVMFAYPEPEPALPSSPPAGGNQPRLPSDRHWNLSVSVRYRPPLARYRPDLVRTALVDLCDVLEQPFATLPSLTAGDTLLRFGDELVSGGTSGLLVTAH